MESLKARINQKKPDYIRIIYYPSCNTSQSLITINNVNNDDQLQKKIKTQIATMTKVHDSYTEYGINDTFQRIYDNETCSHFRREQYLFKCKSNILQGIFIIEFFNKCDENEFPHIIDYHHNISCTSISYNFNKIQIMFSKIIINNSICKKAMNANLQNKIQRVPFVSEPELDYVSKKNNQNKQQNYESNIFDISSEIDIKNFDKSINDFIDHIIKFHE